MEKINVKRKRHSTNNRILANYEGYHLTPYNKNKKVKNFSPGPTNIPSKIFDSLGEEIFNQTKWNQGVSPLELSHRSPEFQKIKKSCETLIRQLLQVPKNYSILWTHGGGNGQFSAVPLNMFKSDKPAGYFINGLWSHKSSVEAEKYGIVNYQKNVKKIYDVESIIEKPKPNTVKSNLAVVGRFILTPKIFKFLRQIKPGHSNELQLTDALDILAKDHIVKAYEFAGKRFDCGSKIGLLKATMSYAKDHPEVRKEFMDIIKNEDI